MKTFCYVRLARSEEQSLHEQADNVKELATKSGFRVVNTLNSALDSKLLGMLLQKKAVLSEAVVTFRG